MKSFGKGGLLTRPAKNGKKKEGSPVAVTSSSWKEN
jgi:hypothetical protein